VDQLATIQAVRDAQVSRGGPAAAPPTLWQSIPGPLVGPLICIATIVIYTVAVAVGIRFGLRPEGITSVWPATGVALGLMALTERRRWQS